MVVVSCVLVGCLLGDKNNEWTEQRLYVGGKPKRGFLGKLGLFGWGEWRSEFFGTSTKQPGYAIHSLFGRKIIRISKYLLEISGNYLRLHAENTTILVSKVHDVRWQDSTVMDYMPGRRLDEIRDTLNADQLSING